MRTIERNPVFAPLWSCDKRYVCIKGSAGSGKSYDTALYYAVKLISEPRRNLLCVRKVYSSNRNSTFAQLRKAVEALGAEEYFNFCVSPMSITTVFGNCVIFGGVKDASQREKLKSVTVKNGNITDIWIEEATELQKEDFEILDDRLRGELPEGLFYQIRMTFNPVSATHWIKRDFFDRKDKNICLHSSTYRDNIFCDKAYYERMERRKELDPEGYRVYGLGEWGETEGLVFTNYAVREFEDTFENTVYGQDFGFNHANVLLKVAMRDGEIYVIDEIYVRQKTTEEVIELAESWDKDVLMYCDSAEPDRIVSWRKAGFKAVGVKKFKGSLNYSINWIKERKLYIHPRCENTIKEIGSWRWQKDSNGEYTDVPVNINDDAMAALRYATSFWYGKDDFKKGEKSSAKYNFSCEKIKPKGEIGERIEII